MKKISALLMFITVLFLTGCSESPEFTVKDITVPRLNKVPMEGKWTVTKAVFLSDKDPADEKIRNMIGTDLLLGQDGILFQGDFLPQPQFYGRRLSAQDYLKRTYGISPEDLGITGGTIGVVRAVGEDKEEIIFLREKSDRSYIELDQVFFQIRRISDNLSDEDRALLQEELKKPR